MENWNLDLNLVYLWQLILAGSLGAMVGFEREVRAKGAGMRTHFLVALGSVLFMIVSKEVGGDPARIAAQVVSGIGFIGAGTIIMNKQTVHGLTTAAGLWTVAGIGLAVGAGLYLTAAVASVLVLVCLELFRYIRKNRTVHFVFLTSRHDDLIEVTELLNREGYKIIRYTVDHNHKGSGNLKAHLELHERTLHEDENHLVSLMTPFRELTIEKVEW